MAAKFHVRASFSGSWYQSYSLEQHLKEMDHGSMVINISFSPVSAALTSL